MQINFVVSQEDGIEIKKRAKLEGKSVSEYVRDRCILEWTDRELVDLGFGLVVEKLRSRGYPDDYIKDFVGEMLRMLRDIPVYSEEYKYQMMMKRERMRYYGEI